MPLVLELTFSKYCELDSQLHLPHSLDMRNGTNREEINLEFLDWNNKYLMKQEIILKFTCSVCITVLG